MVLINGAVKAQYHPMRLVILLILATLICGDLCCSSNNLTELAQLPALRISLLPAHQLMGPDSVVIIDTRTGQSSYEKADYWGATSQLCGDEHFASTSHRFKELRINLDSVPALKPLLEHFGTQSLYSAKEERLCCNQRQGLLALTLLLRRAHYGDADPAHPDRVDVSNRRAIQCQVLLVFSVSDSSFQLIDTAMSSWGYESRTRNHERGFTVASFDSAGKSLHYSKHGRAYRFELGAKQAAPLADYSWTMIAGNSDAILAYSDKSQRLDLLDANFSPAISISSDFEIPLTCFRVEPSKFAVGTLQGPSFMSPPQMRLSIVDFDNHTNMDIVNTFIGEIVEVQTAPASPR